MLLLSIWNLTLPQRSINDRCKRLRDKSSTVFKKTRWNVIQANGFLGLKPFKLFQDDTFCHFGELKYRATTRHG